MIDDFLNLLSKYASSSVTLFKMIFTHWKFYSSLDRKMLFFGPLFAVMFSDCRCGVTWGD